MKGLLAISAMCITDCTETGQLTCPDGSCIMSEWLCDGEADCPSNWDEQNCCKI